MKETTMTTGKVRLSYEHLFKPYAHQPGQEAKFSVTILVPKSDVSTKQRIDAAIEAATQEGIREKWGGVKPPIVANPVYDGDGVRPNGDPFGEECKGHWVFTASSKVAPQIVDLNLNPIIDQSQIYSGIYARVSVTFFAYNTNGKRGVGCGLNAVQKLEDGEPLGGRVSVEEAFGAPAQQPQYQQPVQQTYAQSQYQQPSPQQYQATPGGAYPTTLNPLTGLPF